MAGKYAVDTNVQPETSRGEIERTLTKYGATQFIGKIEVDENGCWIWQGYINEGGYGRIGNEYVHRILCLVNGPIPDGWTVDHLCRVRACCRPSHLEACTRGENVLRGMHAKAVAWRNRTCTQGHPMSGDNLYTSPKGQTQCRACRRVRHRDQSRRRRELARA